MSLPTTTVTISIMVEASATSAAPENDSTYRSGEYGVIGAEQGDETFLDDRDDVVDQDGKIRFSKRKLYGRDKELRRLSALYNDENNAQHLMLSGYSGSGKSALVHEFARQQKLTGRLIAGKYDELQTSDPFSAITTALGRFFQHYLQEKRSGDDLTLLQHIWNDLEDTVGSQDSVILAELVPHLSACLEDNDDGSAKSLDTRSSRLSRSTAADRAGKSMNKTRMKYIFQCLIRSVCSWFENDNTNRRLVMFLDDLQWADDASLELLSTLLEDASLKWMFIGAYRSNEVHEHQPLNALLNDLQTSNEDIKRIQMMDLTDLTRNHVGEFIGDTLGLPHEDVENLSEAIFSKTLGNIFFTMQAIEQLVRKNALYYDNMVFSWQWNLSKDQLQDQLSNDILEMVKAKIENLPEKLQHILVTASFVRATFDVDTLFHVLSSIAEKNGDIIAGRKEVTKYLDQAVFEGLLVEMAGGNEEYAFAHDRIQEAARTYIKSSDDRDALLISVGNALAVRGEEEDGEDWMLFTAARHLNAVSVGNYDRKGRIKLAQLNSVVAKLSTGVAGFEEATKALRTGLDILGDEQTRWTEHYDLTVSLLNLLMDNEFGLGNHEELQHSIEEVLAHARSVKDKGRAFIHSVGIISIAKERDHAKALNKGKEVLELLGIDITEIDIDNVTASDIEKQERICNKALGGHSISEMFDSHQMEDDTILIVLDKMAGSSVMSGRLAFNYILSRVAIGVCALNGISPYLPRIVVYECLYFRKLRPDYKKCYEVALLCQEMLDRIPGVSCLTLCKVRGGCWNGGIVLQSPMGPSVDAFEQCHKDGVKAGDTEWAFITAMCFGLAFYSAGRQMTALTEAKFAYYEAEARRFRQPPSVYVVYSIMRQFCLGMQGRSTNPCILDGKAMTEKSVLENFEEGTSPFKQTKRDLDTFKIMAAVIFGDSQMMGSLAKDLSTWPQFDILACRGYLRNIWVAFACYELSRSKLKDKFYLDHGKKMMQWFQEGAKKGDPNDNVAFLCLQAESKQTKKNYDIAIKGCADLSLIHMEALMNERCGLCQLKRKKQQHAEDYLKRAIGLYNRWGATAKVARMRQDQEFLRSWSPQILRGFRENSQSKLK